MAFDVFISCSSRDKPVGDAVCATLESAGIRCWIAPRDILPGLEYGAAIVAAIAESRAMVLVFSSHANISNHVKREVERAVNHGLAIIPLRIEDVQPEGALEFYINTPHWLDAFTPPMKDHLGRLAEVARIILASAETETPIERKDNSDTAATTDYDPVLDARLQDAGESGDTIDGILRSWITHLFSFKGRASRSECLLAFLIAAFAVFFGATFSISSLSALSESYPSVALNGISAISALLSMLAICICFYILVLAVSVRRLHDMGLSGIWAMLVFLPLPVLLTRSVPVILMSLLVFSALLVWRGAENENRYGPNPLGRRRVYNSAYYTGNVSRVTITNGRPSALNARLSWVASRFLLKGRISRTEWALTFLIAIPIGFLSAILMFIVLGWLSPADGLSEHFKAVTSFFTAVVVFYAILYPASVRRMHDTERRDGLALATFLPVTALISGDISIILACCVVFLVFLFLPGTRGANSYGADPRQVG